MANRRGAGGSLFRVVGLLGILGITAIAETRAAVPKVLDAREIRGLAGKAVDLQAPRGGVAVLVFYSSECPISNAYFPSLNQLRDRYSAPPAQPRGHLRRSRSDRRRRRRRTRGFRRQVPGRPRSLSAGSRPSSARRSRPRRSSSTTRGSSAITAGSTTSSPRRQKRNANLVLAGAARRPGRRPGGPQGRCPARRGGGLPAPRTPPRPSSTPTYCKDVAPILQKHCAECHRPGQIGPFALQTYEQARKRAGGHRRVDRGPLDASLEGRPSLRSASSRTIPRCRRPRSQRSSPGPRPALRGRPGRPPCRRSRSPTNGAIGTPDLIFEPETAFTIPANRADVYRCFVIPTSLPEDMYISRLEYQPGNRRDRPPRPGLRGQERQGPQEGRRGPGPGFDWFSSLGVQIHGDLGRTARPCRRRGTARNGLVPAQGCRRDHAGSLPPQRQARDRPHAHRPPLRPQARAPDRSSWLARQHRNSSPPGRFERRGHGSRTSPPTSSPTPSPRTCICWART